MRRIASTRPGTGACTLASAMNLWAWSLHYLQNATDPAGGKLYHGQRQGVTFALADALSWLMASRCQILDVLELETRGAADAVAAEGLAGNRAIPERPLPHAGRASRRRGFAHLRRAGLWLQPPSRVGRGRASQLFPIERARRTGRNHARHHGYGRRCSQADGSHPAKAGPCAGCAGSSEFLRLQSKLTTCLTGARLAKDRAAETVSKVMIPEALDYPA
jgi:hypothetical protein